MSKFFSCNKGICYIGMQRDHWDFKSEISPIPPEKLKSEFSASLNTKKPALFFLWQKQEKRKSLQAVNNNYFQRDQCECCNSGCFIRAGWHFLALKEEQRTSLKAFLSGKDVFSFPSFYLHCSLPQGCDEHLLLPLTLILSLKLLLPGSTVWR